MRIFGRRSAAGGEWPRAACGCCGRPIAQSPASGLWWAADGLAIDEAPSCAHEPAGYTDGSTWDGAPVADYMHIAGSREHRRRSPRAVCGASLEGYCAGVTMCPACVAIEGMTADEVAEYEGWLRADREAV
jgi:hypothetical protein